jgi:hypothetical protein
LHSPEGQPQNLAIYMAGIGYTARGIAKAGRELLAKLGIEPLDALEEQKKLVREQIAKPDTPPELREHLLGILGFLNNLPDHHRPTEDTEFPAEGFTIGGE